MVRDVPQSNRTNGQAPVPVSPSGATSPWAVLAAALAAGYLLAKAIDWRSHAHPRR